MGFGYSGGGLDLGTVEVAGAVYRLSQRGSEVGVPGRVAPGVDAESGSISPLFPVPPLYKQCSPATSAQPIACHELPQTTMHTNHNLPLGLLFPQDCRQNVAGPRNVREINLGSDCVQAGLRQNAARACPSSRERKHLRTSSASSTERELECVFSSVMPTSGKTSRIALLLTPSSTAKSLILTFTDSFLVSHGRSRDFAAPEPSRFEESIRLLVLPKVN